MFSKPIRTHVLYESSGDGLPHGCSYIRLLLPLAHPSVEADVQLSQSLEFPDCPVDILIIERLWDHTCDWGRHLTILQNLRTRGTKIVYEMDDDLLSVNSDMGARDWPTTQQKMWIRQMVRFADCVIVSTQELADRLAQLNPRIQIIENALDERLFDRSHKIKTKEKDGVVVFGYMGTFTHLDDLISIIQPLRSILDRYHDRVRFEIVGVGDGVVLEAAFKNLPVRFLSLPTQAVSYERFTAWMQENISWDFGIAPLINTQFTKSKSDIKFLDYAVLGIPGVFSNVPAYNKTVKHLENGILANGSQSWMDGLEKMILENELRFRLATKAHEEVWAGRMLKTLAAKWSRCIQEVNVDPGKNKKKG
jgi:glycosyltransferase involved in cell wall biosynthesis